MRALRSSAFKRFELGARRLGFAAMPADRPCDWSRYEQLHGALQKDACPNGRRSSCLRLRRPIRTPTGRCRSAASRSSTTASAPGSQKPDERDAARETCASQAEGRLAHAFAGFDFTSSSSTGAAADAAPDRVEKGRVQNSRADLSAITSHSHRRGLTPQLT